MKSTEQKHVERSSTGHVQSLEINLCTFLKPQGADDVQQHFATNWEEALDRYEKIVGSETEIESMKVKATIKLAQVSKLVPESILAKTITILAAIIGDDPLDESQRSVQGAVVYCLECIACLGDGQLAIEIGRSGILHSLLRLLPNSDNGFRRILVKCVRNLVTFGSSNRAVVARNGGLELIVSLLGSCTDDTRLYLLEILSALTLLREVRRALMGMGGLHFLVEAARYGSMVSRERACHAIGLLAVTRQARRMFVELGAVLALVELFRIGDGKAKLVAGNSLGVLSAHVDYIRLVGQAGAIPLYAELLEGADPTGKEIAEDAFCVLAVAEVNAIIIAEKLARILREGDDEAKAAAADVLWDLSGYKHSVPIVQNSGAIPILVDLLTDRNDNVREKVSGAIAQLSYNKMDRETLADAGVVPILIELLRHESDELRDNAAEALVNFSEDPVQHEMVAEIVNAPLFQSMQNRLIQLRTSDEHMGRSMRRMGIQQLTWDPALH